MQYVLCKAESESPSIVHKLHASECLQSFQDNEYPLNKKLM